ncbi:PRC-barrel domain-containing protein [Phaeobacter gallaeciensis]|uniref:PRC-barrel domain protein n=1 Tax=Phaeobacter gallaeciensis TaxID=60890 RepID=A0AAC9ZDM0_9RHOB|nr:PRC-barrel domain-containing protein [Phaeobacter gallaeciensis]AHD11928.1 PRC-barrel domain protein [Phaeobacter gallaeciensis DSM 26640]ATE95194.1 PRC-barrel domain protein [Phaeobacter gallaeciensis]ATE99585.1 PRC-barrel domain protein [Phaeobacter gallaeciensis]ATF03899.1 PRC-barrel domain protein [Phaeobacter gallaeciensis]ATF08175.1 PRC-barrel domain protein [Phaeobacter gallaeciensis]
MKNLLLSTAIALTPATAVLADGHGDMFRAEADPMAIHASEFIGMRVYRAENGQDATEYNGVQKEWDDIGEINDVVLNRDGTVDSVLVDIGGFLGMGENQVAVDMKSVKFVADSSTAEDLSDFFLVMEASADVLKEAPTYDWTRQADAATDEMKQDATAAAGEIKNDADAMAENTEETVKDVFERDGFANVVATDLTSEELTGAPLYDSNDEWIGEVSQINLTNDGKVKSIVADIGGFLGLGEKPVELELSKMDVLRADDGGDLRAYVSMSKEELEQLPDYEQ